MDLQTIILTSSAGVVGVAYLFVRNYMRKSLKGKIVNCTKLPRRPNVRNIYNLGPKNFNWPDYLERINRNYGILSEKHREQDLLLDSTVGIAGCGGMGGNVSEALARGGIGRIKIADLENFDLSNTNRQAAANKETIGQSKAISTGREIRKIADNTDLIIFPRGIRESTVHEFVQGCTVVIDLLEYWAIDARILLHKVCRELKVPILNANTVGFGTFLWRFTDKSMPLEDALGVTYFEAKILQKKIQNKTATREERGRVQDAIWKIFVPIEHEYCIDPSIHSNTKEMKRRLKEEGKASIVFSNPLFASGFLLDHIVFEILRKSEVKRHILYPVDFPGFLHHDAALGISEKFEGVYWL